MTQMDLPLTHTLTEALRQYFLARPNEWLDARGMAGIGGFGGWRTRISDLRLRYGMTIENRVRREKNYTISEYRYFQPGAGQPGREVAA